MLPTFNFASLSAVPQLRHLVSTRHGGVSLPPFASLNLGTHVGDNPHQVRLNRQLLAQEAAYNAANLISAQQTHSPNVSIVTAADAGRGALDWESAIPDTDALVTSEANLPLMILVADCAPLLLVDVRHHVLAVVHAGWRGAVARIASKAVQAMTARFDTRPEELLVGIGPCLCTNCMEIGEDVEKEVQPVAPSAVIARESWSKPHLDLRTLLQTDLVQAGLLASHIETMPQCPRCQNDTFFSHRGERGQTGRFGIVAWWVG